MDIDWAGSLGGVDTGLKTILNAGKIAKLEQTFVEEVVLAMGEVGIGAGTVFMAGAAVVMTVVAGVTKTLINLANDGGRVNFVAVIAHAVNRITACVQPAPTAPSNLQLPTINLNGLGYTWITTQKDSNVISGKSFTFQNSLFAGTYPDCIPNNEEEFYKGVLVNDFDTDVLYPVGAPELSWSLNGAGMMLSSKIEVDANGDTIYGIALMIFNHTGHLMLVSTFMEVGASSSSIIGPSPICYPASYLIPDEVNCGVYPLGVVIASEFSNTDIYQPSSLQLEWVIPEMMVAFQNNTVMTTPPSGDWTKMPQPSTGYSISWILGIPSYDTGQHPAIAIDSNYHILQFHEGGSSNIYWDAGNLSGNTINWTDVGNKHNGGDWPALALRNDNTFLEIHSGGTIDLYWDSGMVTWGTDSSSIKWVDDDGTYISDGNHPTMAMNGSGLIVVMFTQGNSDLQYNIGQLSGSGSSTSIEWNATLVGYAGGDHASVVMNDNGCIVEVHSDGGDLYYNVGAVSGSSITWNSVDASNSPAPLPLHVEGAHTALALRSDGLVCLIYDKDSSTYYGLGMLDATNKKINWITLNNRYNQGAYAALDFAPDGRIVETHQSSESDDALFWNIGAVTTP